MLAAVIHIQLVSPHGSTHSQGPGGRLPFSTPARLPSPVQPPVPAPQPPSFLSHTASHRPSSLAVSFEPSKLLLYLWGSARALPWESLLSPELPAAGGPSARLSRQPNMTRALSGTLDSERFRVSVPPDGGCREATAEIGHCLLREQMSW